MPVSFLYDFISWVVFRHCLLSASGLRLVVLPMKWATHLYKYSALFGLFYTLDKHTSTLNHFYNVHTDSGSLISRELCIIVNRNFLTFWIFLLFVRLIWNDRHWNLWNCKRHSNDLVKSKVGKWFRMIKLLGTNYQHYQPFFSARKKVFGYTDFSLFVIKYRKKR